MIFERLIMSRAGRFERNKLLEYQNNHGEIRRAEIVGRQVKDRDTYKMFDSHLSWALDEVRFAVCLDSTTVPIPVCYKLPGS